MENSLGARDKVGVQDFVLLENHQDPEAFLDNLKKRFKENLIYVSPSIYYYTFLYNYVSSLSSILLIFLFYGFPDLHRSSACVCQSIQKFGSLFK